MVKKISKFLAYLVLAVFVLEAGSYSFDIRFSDLVYHVIKSSDDELVINEKFGVDVIDYIENEDLPSSWNEDGLMRSTVLSLDDKYEKSRFVRILKEELEKIPDKVIKENLQVVYPLEAIYLDQIFVGGSYDVNDKKIFITIKNKDKGRMPDAFVKGTFHHELSSILMKAYGFGEVKWRSVFDDGFKYKSEEDPFYMIVYLQGDADEISGEKLFSRGLLKQYAETGYENDFNIYAETIFTEPHKLKQLINQYPVIKRKYEVFKAFYLSIDKGFAPVFERIDG